MGAEKTSRINIRVSQSEHDAVTRRARAAGLSYSEYIRRAVLSDGSRPIIRTDPEGLRKVYVDLKRAGNLLNQCARELNTYHQPDAVEERLKTALVAVANASSAVSKFIADARKSV